jgi:hypothetical protein
MQSVFQVQPAAVVKALGATVFNRRPDRPPALRVGSRIRWRGIQESGGTINGPMLILLHPQHQRVGRRR